LTAISITRPCGEPGRVTYDPEELCRRYEAGELTVDLLRIPPMPQGKTDIFWKDSIAIRADLAST
jgi:hypothetical protein